MVYRLTCLKLTHADAVLTNHWLEWNLLVDSQSFVSETCILDKYQLLELYDLQYILLLACKCKTVKTNLFDILELTKVSMRSRTVDTTWWRAMIVILNLYLVCSRRSWGLLLVKYGKINLILKIKRYSLDDIKHKWIIFFHDR